MDKQFFDDVVNVVRVAHYRIFSREINNDTARPMAMEIIKENKFPRFVAQWLQHLPDGELHPTVDFLKQELKGE